MNRILSFGMFVACCGQVFAMQCDQKKVSHSDSKVQGIQYKTIETPRGKSEGENAATNKNEWLSDVFKKRLENMRNSFSDSNSEDECLAVIKADKFLIAKDEESFKKIEDLERQASETKRIEEVHDIDLQNVGALFVPEYSLDLSKQIRDLYFRTHVNDKLVLWSRIVRTLSNN